MHSCRTFLLRFELFDVLLHLLHELVHSLTSCPLARGLPVNLALDVSDLVSQPLQIIAGFSTRLEVHLCFLKLPRQLLDAIENLALRELLVVDHDLRLHHRQGGGHSRKIPAQLRAKIVTAMCGGPGRLRKQAIVQQIQADVLDLLHVHFFAVQLLADGALPSLLSVDVRVLLLRCLDQAAVALGSLWQATESGYHGLVEQL
mmetsp:Transcript_58440/g.148517  ORF Transcript_58440/g.148517 Transcript_58440/m.148517 type:complete len:202 (-) Transcript_58440:50-655(-)